METAIDFQGRTIRFLVLAGDQPRENHEDVTIRLLIQRERRRGIEERKSLIYVPGRA